MNLTKMSVEELRRLALIASQTAEELKKELPSYNLAIQSGIKDDGYKTVRHGWVSKYSGEVIIKMANGKKFLAIGHGPQGGPDWVGSQGYIEFRPL